MMDHPMEAPLEVATRQLRRYYVAYRRDAYPCYGEGRLPLLGYRAFRDKARMLGRIQQTLEGLYAAHPRLAEAPPAARARMVDLESQASLLEMELCWS